MDHKIPINPNWKRVETPESSQFKEVAHNPKAQIMYVNFRSNNSVYSYEPVTEKQFESLVYSPSRGSYFHKHFKKSPTIKVKPL